MRSWALSSFCSTMFRTGGTTSQAQLAVAAISRLDVDVAPFVGTTRERFAAVLGSCVRASSSKTRRPALPPETQRQADAAEPSHPRQRPRGDSQTGIGNRGSAVVLGRLTYVSPQAVKHK